ncbi:hypothetical protein B0H17DRAFT_1147888 [Mycena rosella]|uniref:Uncharacterized protein n=1 Tax=Mycena rosella TaxID=1033263 RepID=A0AAD7CHD4_MYCRO|nr:hypothetical protein B0H17DRAFT_1147888 [Mycena rosella]
MRACERICAYALKDVERDDMGIALQDRMFKARLDHLRAHGTTTDFYVVYKPDVQGGMPQPLLPSPHPDAQPDIDFLRTFLIQTGLKKLYGPLKNIGVDGDGLRRMARYDEEWLDAFMVKLGTLVPEMTPFDRLTLSEEIRRLPEGAIVVD